MSKHLRNIINVLSWQQLQKSKYPSCSVTNIKNSNDNRLKTIHKAFYILTWILLVLKWLHPLLLVQRPLLPRLSTLIPHLLSLYIVYISTKNNSCMFKQMPMKYHITETYISADIVKPCKASWSNAGLIF